MKYSCGKPGIKTCAYVCDFACVVSLDKKTNTVEVTGNNAPSREVFDSFKDAKEAFENKKFAVAVCLLTR